MNRRFLRHFSMALALAAGLLAIAPGYACDESLQSRVAAAPDDTDARYALARSCARAGRQPEALAQYDRLLAHDANNADWLLGRAQAQVALGQSREALATLERAHTVAPGYEDVLILEARVRESLRPARAARAWLSGAYEDLSGGRPSWRSTTAGLDRRLGPHRHVNAGIHVEERFDEQDEQFSLGFADRPGGDWSYGVALDVAPDGVILPEWNLVMEAARALPQEMTLNLRARHADYVNVDVDSLAVGVEKYFSALRAGYTLTAAEPSGLGTSFGHTLRIAHDYGDASHVTLALGYGEEAETIAPGVVQVTTNRSVSLNGLHWHSAAWGFTWEAGWYEQGDLYDRTRIGLGLQYRF
jgi:YaiO family outer membrane protein